MEQHSSTVIDPLTLELAAHPRQHINIIIMNVFAVNVLNRHRFRSRAAAAAPRSSCTAAVNSVVQRGPHAIYTGSPWAPTAESIRGNHAVREDKVEGETEGQESGSKGEGGKPEARCAGTEKLDRL